MSACLCARELLCVSSHSCQTHLGTSACKLLTLFPSCRPCPLPSPLPRRGVTVSARDGDCCSQVSFCLNWLICSQFISKRSSGFPQRNTLLSAAHRGTFTFFLTFRPVVVFPCVVTLTDTQQEQRPRGSHGHPSGGPLPDMPASVGADPTLESVHALRSPETLVITTVLDFIRFSSFSLTRLWR